MLSNAFCSRSSLPIPCSSRPKAIFCNTVRWGNSPKCWKTMASSLRRTVRSSSSVMVAIFLPLTAIAPKVGLLSRLMQRNKLDFPLPLSPIMTNISPSLMVKLAPFTATVHPVSFLISCLLFPFISILNALFHSRPKIR